MTRTVHSILTAAAITAAALAFPACPPQSGQGPVFFNQDADIKDYWPMQVGNYWEFRHRTKEFGSFTYTVEEDYSTEEIGAWKVAYVYHEEEAEPVEEFNYYFILREDYLWIVYNFQVLQHILDNPDIPLTPGNFLDIVAPRYIPRGSDLSEFMTNDIGEKVYTSTGRIRDYTEELMCPTATSPSIPVVSYVVPQTFQAVAIHQDQFCGVAKSLLAQTVFAANVGPVHRFDSHLVYAIVNGNEYIAPND